VAIAVAFTLLGYADLVDHAALRDRLQALKDELAEIQTLNAHYSSQSHRTWTETQARARRRERLEQIVAELAALKGSGQTFGG
jgi:ABC-type uncharacterized transport system fused permease/ATPase subunit